MSKKIISVTKENFPQAVKYAYSLNGKMAANAYAQKIVLPLGSLLFAFHVFIFLLGIALAIATENSVSLAILDAVPALRNYCFLLWDGCNVITENIYCKILLCIAVLYLLPLVVCGIVRLMIAIFMRGEKPVIEGTDAQKAKRLYSYVKNAPLPKKDPYKVGVFWCRIGGIPTMICFAAAILYTMYTTLDAEKSTLWMLIAFAVISLLEAALLYVLYGRLHFLLTFFMKPYYDCRKEQKNFQKTLEQYLQSFERRAKKEQESSKEESYDGWKYRRLEETEYYKSKFNEYYAKYMGQPYESDEDRAKRIVREVEEDLSGGGWGDY